MNKFIFSLCLLAVLAFTSTPSYSIERCDDCPTFKVGLFDANITPARPDDPKEIWAWVHLFHFGKGVRHSARQDDPRKDCIRWIDGGVWNAANVSDQNGVFRAGVTYSNLPPPGPLPDLEYLIESQVDGEQGNYTGVAHLEDATTREVIASVSVTFSDGMTALEEGFRAGKQLLSVFERIRELQKKKRDETNGMICPKLKLTPDKTTLEGLETIGVSLEVYDCDGKPGEHPIKNTEVEIHALSGGSVDKGKVTTDSEGKARFNFTAQNEPGAGVIAAFLQGMNVMHHIESGEDKAVVKIKQGETLWRFVADSGYTQSDEFDGIDDNDTRVMYRYDITYQSEASGFFKLKPEENGEEPYFSSFASDPEPTVVGMNARGSWDRLELRREFKGSDGYIEHGLISNDHANGILIDGNENGEGPSIEITYSPSEKTFSVKYGYAFQVEGFTDMKYWWTAGDPPAWKADHTRYEDTVTNDFGTCTSDDPDVNILLANRRTLHVVCTLKGDNHVGTLDFLLERIL